MIVQPRRRNPTRIQAILWFLGFKDGQRLFPRLTLPRFMVWSKNPRHIAAYNDVVGLHALILQSKRPPDATEVELHADTPERLSLFEGDLSPELTVLQGGNRSEMRAVADLEPSFRPRLVSSPPPPECNSRAGSPLPRSETPERWPSRWRRGTWAALGAAVAMAAIYWTGALPDLGGKSFVTGPGQQRMVILADGSQVTMGGGTELRVRYTSDLRTIELDRGEALFNDVHDPKRPFVVRAGEGIITAIGTRFLVRRYSRYSNRIEVWVTGGMVQVAPLRGMILSLPSLLSSVSWTPVRLASGEQMSYTDRGSTTATKRSDPQPAAELTEGMFIYHGRPLGEVIEDVQRYTPETIALDPQAAKLRYSGSVIERDVRQWLRGLPQIFPGVRISQQPDRIAISYDPEPGDGDAPGSAIAGGPD